MIFNKEAVALGEHLRGGGGNGSGRGPTPPDLDKIIKEFQEKIKSFTRGSSSGGKQAILVLIILGFVWLASGLYRVLPDEQGVVRLENL